MFDIVYVVTYCDDGEDPEIEIFKYKKSASDRFQDLLGSYDYVNIDSKVIREIDFPYQY